MEPVGKEYKRQHQVEEENKQFEEGAKKKQKQQLEEINQHKYIRCLMDTSVMTASREVAASGEIDDLMVHASSNEMISDRNKSVECDSTDKSCSNFEEVCPWKSKPIPPVDLLKGVKWEDETWYYCPKCLTGLWVTTHDVSTHTMILESVELEKWKLIILIFIRGVCGLVDGCTHTKVKMFEIIACNMTVACKK